MIRLLKKIALFFIRNVHLSKFKLLISIPVLLALITSITIDVTSNSFKFSKDSESFKELLAILIFLIILVIIDLVYDLLNKKENTSRRRDLITILKDDSILDEIKDKYLDYIENEF